MLEPLRRPNQLKNIATLRMGYMVGYSVCAVMHNLSSRCKVMGVALLTDFAINNLAALNIIFVWCDSRCGALIPIFFNNVLIPDT